MAARVAMVVAALAIGAWLAFTLRAVELRDEATALAPAPPAPPPAGEQFTRARDLLRRAQRLNPDVRPKVLEAGLLLYAGRESEAAAIFRDVLRDEPANLTAAAGLYEALKDADPAGAAAASRRIRELAPRQ